jgi:hypothetical protein
MAEQKHMSGVLFKNANRRAGKGDPTLQGSCTIDGRRYWVSGWLNDVRQGDHRGEKYLSLRFKLRAAEDRPERPPRPPVADSDLPF